MWKFTSNLYQAAVFVVLATTLVSIANSVVTEADEFALHRAALEGDATAVNELI